MDKRVRVAGTVAACIGLAVLGGAFSIRFQPNGSPFRSDVITLTNDVGEKIVVLKSTVKDEPKIGKEILKTLGFYLKNANGLESYLIEDLLISIEAYIKIFLVILGGQIADKHTLKMSDGE